MYQLPPPKLYIYDLETLRGVFTFSGKFENDPQIQTFEVSWRKNQKAELLSWLSYLQNSGAEMVGFNNLGFDYPIMHELLHNVHTWTHETARLKCVKIINSPTYGINPHMIALKDRVIPQIDLVKINHFDNANKRTSLKALQFAMRSHSVEDLPFHPDKEHYTSEEIDKVISYNHHDVTETEKFLQKCKHLIDMRRELLADGTLTGDVLNFSDVKIGTEYLVSKIGKHKCYSGGKPRRTLRESVPFREIILPKIQFRTEPFHAVLEWFKAQTTYVNSEDEPPKLQVRLAGIDFFFGVGGVHASVENKTFHSNKDFVIKDIDVAGMYPSVAVVNGFGPEHLGQAFLDAYAALKTDRKHYQKGTSKNKTLKLAGNAAFGNGDNVYSPFYDPKFPKSITINGQLQALQLAEVLSLIPGVQLIQANTDGITIYMPRHLEPFFRLWKESWEKDTRLELEEVEYQSMWIRDVNNYMALTTDGKIKRKGAYAYPESDADYEGNWNKDYSMMIVQKVTEQVLLKGWNPEALIRLASDPFDFMLRYKTPAGAVVKIGEKECSKTVRYYVSRTGEPMVKVSKPKGMLGLYKRKNGITDKYYRDVMDEINAWNQGGQWDANRWDERIHTKNKSRYEIVETSIESGWLIKECNDASKFDWSDVNYDYYLKEINKLIEGVNS